jgi:hypothetical protein
MTTFSFTADAATDNITITGHPFVTGDGPVQIDYSGSQTAPLLSATNYWVIRIDANTIRLATSQANAVATTAINITTDGIGPRFLTTRFLYQAPNGPPFPYYKFSADSGTDQLTIAGHGMVTGDGPVNVFNYGTGGLAHSGLPAPLAADTNYWVIRDSADAIRLATSNALAVAGTAINLTTNGTGRSYIGIGLPYGRPRSYAQGSNIFADDSNMLFDAVVGSAQRPRTRAKLPNPNFANATFSLAVNPANPAGPTTIQWTSSGLIRFDLEIQEGETLEDVVVELYGNATVDADVTVQQAQTAASGTSQLLGNNGPLTLSNLPATWTRYSLMPIDRALMTGARLYVQIEPNAANAYLAAIYPVFSRMRWPRG